MIRLAINGFGRIGRLAFRKAMELENFEVVAINDLASPSMLAYLLKYDSVQGAYLGHQVDSTENSLVVDGKEITIYKEPDASNLPWKELNIDLVLECTGFYTSKAKAQAHLDAGAGKVLISAPAGNDMKTIVYGVNHETLTPEDRIVSGASCTTNCLAPMAKALNDYREVRTGFMTTIHAYTGNQKILDAPSKGDKFRRSRAAAINIVPTTTGSITILDATLKDPTDSVTVEGINAAMKAEQNESFGYNEDEIVSTDVIGMSYGSLFDATQTLAQRCGTNIYEVRVVSWYDNEMSYVSQLIRTMTYMASL